MTNTTNTTTNKSPEYFVSQWGYEQTNVSFYKVLKRTAQTVTLIEVKSRRTYIDRMNYVAVPVDELAPQAKPFRRKLRESFSNGDFYDYVWVNDFEKACKWDGTAADGSSSY